MTTEQATASQSTNPCARIAARMEALLRREHTRVMYFEALAQEMAQSVLGPRKGRSVLAMLGLRACPVTQRCLSDMASSVAMALHMMQIELLEKLQRGEGMDHPLVGILEKQETAEHDEMMRVLRMFFYERVDMVREGCMHHELTNKVVLRAKDIERWIAKQSRVADKILSTSGT